MVALKKLIHARQAASTICHAMPGTPERLQAESFITDIFFRQYGARVSSFAPQLMLIETRGRISAAAGWRSASQVELFLENYLDEPADIAISRLAGQTVQREAIVEVGNLAADRPGGSVAVILALAQHLDQLGYEWVAFTATSELIAIFSRIGLPPLALAPADPARLGDDAANWGSYYESQPVVVAGRIRLALKALNLETQ